MNDYLTLYQNHIDKIKPAGSNDQYIGSCLKHEDKNPSFTFNTESGLFHCFSCEFSGNAYQFAQSVGINPKPYRNGTFPLTESHPNQVSKNKRKVVKSGIREMFLNELDKKQAFSYYKQLLENFDELTKGLTWNIEAVNKTFTGYDPETKRFTFLHTDINGKALNVKWHKSKTGEQPFSIKGHGACRLYPLNLLKDYNHDLPLIFCEGEKDVITLLSRGFQAVTSTTGVENYPKDLTPLKRFKNITIVYDHDKAGAVGSVKLAKALKQQSPESEIIITSWENDAPEKWDISDHFQQKKDMGKLLDEFDELLASGKIITLKIPKKIGVFTIMTGKEASNTTPPQSEWLIENVLPKKFNSLLAGTTGSKKSLYAMELGMSLANGEKYFCGNRIIPLTTNVMYVDTEIGKDETHRRYKSIKNQMHWRGDKNFNMLTKSGTIEDVWDNVHEAYTYFKPQLIIFDSLYNSTSVGDFSRADQIQKVINSLNQYKERYGVTVLAIHHFNKGGNELGLDIDRMTGAAQLKNWVEWCTIMVKTNEPDFNLWTVAKSRGFAHDETIIGLKWDNYKFKAMGVIDDYKPLLISSEKKKKWQAVIEDCPEKFNSEEWLNVFFTKQNLSERTGRQWLKECSNTPMLEKIGHNSYKKKLKLLNDYNHED